MLIAIPSKGRHDRQVTLANLTATGQGVRNPIYVVVPHGELNKYRAVQRAGSEVVSTPPDVVGIAATRHWILTELGRHDKYGRVFMVDDDMDFCYRPVRGEPRLELCRTRERNQAVVDLMEEWLDLGFVHVGVSARQGNNRPFYDPTGTDFALHDYRDAGRMMNAYAYDTRKLRKLGTYGRTPVMEDFDLTLQLFRRGYPNRVSFQYCWNQRNSGARGGCSTYRTAELQAQAANQLREFHPDFVRLKVKQSKPGSESWKGMKERVDVLVDWRKAFASSGKKIEGQP